MTSPSPKRKRGHALPLDTKGPFSRLWLEEDVDDYGDGASPRTKVAKHLDDLQIDSPEANSRHGVDCIEMSNHPELSALSAAPKEESGNNTERQPHQTPIDVPRSTLAESVTESPISKSPPLGGEISEHLWHDSEITGHDPNDPSDDLYGINGIGFRPTAAVAWSRSQQRKKQLAEYKNREAREARQQRSERRKRFISDSDDAPSLDSSPRKSMRVRFEDG
ncbi:hypothetical protein LTR10_013663 [Elasticomyces elasticus]|uniref:BZIP domain-containing protein n=1 Tax=Exophiala sideris TaxID=1016849 RepID=A0ABR0JGW4_9EURO|nr:hypothetical protein LTR10_013663 [Elasticomyces elasticus]KAK5033363.1 hypothetical protein LTS07_003665 [Exophiala sideris]KAK5042141.1 hypothetical protein LTR13_001947 [Exophiala sideris]KAK5063907.1 hypothetical protein LTR69_003673 [Exophiala sideris]KAK5185409.1 hypothetical protein LTR44_002398 [Eurotiomycetes sp. CCFEE 6388]